MGIPSRHHRLWKTKSWSSVGWCKGVPAWLRKPPYTYWVYSTQHILWGYHLETGLKLAWSRDRMGPNNLWSRCDSSLWKVSIHIQPPAPHQEGLGLCQGWRRRQCGDRSNEWWLLHIVHVGGCGHVQRQYIYNYIYTYMCSEQACIISLAVLLFGDVSHPSKATKLKTNYCRLFCRPLWVFRKRFHAQKCKVHITSVQNLADEVRFLVCAPHVVAQALWLSGLSQKTSSLWDVAIHARSLALELASCDSGIASRARGGGRRRDAPCSCRRMPHHQDDWRFKKSRQVVGEEVCGFEQGWLQCQGAV